MPDYRELFTPGSRVRIAPRTDLEAFRATWTLHNPLQAEQLVFAEHEAVVKGVGFYHGGDPLYTLVDIPGVWHEPCLVASSSHAA